MSGSDNNKQRARLGVPCVAAVTHLFDYCFAENGITAYKLGVKLLPVDESGECFIKWNIEDRYKKIIELRLDYLANLNMLFQQGLFLEHRKSMINLSSIGVKASREEWILFEVFKKEHKV
jgi:phosphomannomutase